MTPAEQQQQAYRQARLNLLECIAQLLKDQPFYGHLVLHIQPMPTPRVSTIASDGITLYYNPFWAQHAPQEQLQLALLRIVTSLGLTHHLRRDEREEFNWQLASLIISLTQLYQHGCLSIYDLFFDPRDWDTWVEQAYDRLPPQPPGDGPGSGGDGQMTGSSAGEGSGDGESDDDDSATGGQGGPNEDQEPEEEPLHSDQTTAQLNPNARVIDMADYGIILDSPLPQNATQSDIEQARQEQMQRWNDATEQSAFIAKSQGYEPGWLDAYIQAYRKPKINWRETLRDFIDQSVHQESTWSHPNRRFIADGLYLPGVEHTGCPPIYFAVDTSGSMTDHELALVWTEVKAAAEAARPEYIRVLQCDAAIHSDQTYECEDIPDQTLFKGRGGTGFAPVFELVNAEDPPPACLIYLTDLYCDDYHQPPIGYPVIWVATPEASNQDPPWGLRIDINES